MKVTIIAIEGVKLALFLGFVGCLGAWTLGA